MMTVPTANRRIGFRRLLASLQKAADYNHDDMVPPAAILWTDEKREWERLVPRLRMVLPQFLVFGPYDTANRTGPAIWLRCVLAGRIPETPIPTGSVPIIYLPGVSRATIRATEECPQELKPLAELQYRGVFWSQANGKDWTVTAFLQTNQGGLQLKIARDNATAASIRRALEKLVDVPVAELQAKSAGGELNSSLFRFAGERRPGGRPALVACRPEGHAGPLGSGPLGNPVQPVYRAITASTRPATVNSWGPRSSACKRSRSGRQPGNDSPRSHCGMRGCWNSCERPSRRRSRATCSPRNGSSPGRRTTRPRKPRCASRRCSRRLAVDSSVAEARKTLIELEKATSDGNGSGPS